MVTVPFVADRAGPGSLEEVIRPQVIMHSYLSLPVPVLSTLGAEQQGFSSCGAILFLFSFMDTCINQGGLH